MEVHKKNYIKYREKIIEEFNGKCGYCRHYVGHASGQLDHYFPKSKFPELIDDYKNLVLACNYCNRKKADQSPINETGEKIILNPREDNFNEHIKQDKGILVGQTDLGKKHIQFFDLNQKDRVQDRIDSILSNLVGDHNYDIIEPIINNHNNSYISFLDSINNLEELLTINMPSESSNDYYLKMLYANVITILETYLSDTFINNVMSKEVYIRRFTETFIDYQYEQIRYNDIFKYYENCAVKVAKTMAEIIYHNIPKVKGIYKSTLDIKFLTEKELVKIYKAVSVRHDIVHRNGKNKKGEIILVTKDSIQEIIVEVKKLVNHIQSQLK